MPGTSIAPAERARKIVSIVCKQMQEPGRAVAVATSLGVSESTISRLKNEHLESFAGLLAHLGLKVVPVEEMCFPSDRISALLTLAKERLDGIQSIDQLSGE